MGLILLAFGQNQVVVFCEHGNECSCCVICRNLVDKLRLRPLSRVTVLHGISPVKRHLNLLNFLVLISD